MRIQKIRIISNNICYGPEPSQKYEVEQHLTISANGRVVLSRYNYGQEPGKYELSSRKKISITEENAYIILNAIGIYFESNSVDVFTTDIGTWDLVITGDDGERTYSGSLCNSLEVNGDDLSDLIRDILGSENLFVFDGNYKPDRIEKINMNYHRVSKIKPKAPVVEIVNIEFFSEEDAPFPIEKTKYIIKKCNDDDFNVTKFNNAEENKSYIHSVLDKKLKENTWTEIRNQEDIDKLMYDFGGFHDGCLKELRYLSGEYVNKDLSMYPLNSERNIYAIFQRQWKNPSVVEMVFEGVECMTLNPRNEDYDGIIYGAYMVIQDGKFIWFDCDEFKDDYRELYEYNDVTWIKAETVKWRVVDNYLGDEDVFIYRG